MTDTSGEKDPAINLANLHEYRRAFPTQAYMLIYIREEDLEHVLAVPS